MRRLEIGSPAKQGPSALAIAIFERPCLRKIRLPRAKGRSKASDDPRSQNRAFGARLMLRNLGVDLGMVRKHTADSKNPGKALADHRFRKRCRGEIRRAFSPSRRALSRATSSASGERSVATARVSAAHRAMTIHRPERCRVSKNWPGREHLHAELDQHLGLGTGIKTADRPELDSENLSRSDRRPVRARRV